MLEARRKRAGNALGAHRSAQGRRKGHAGRAQDAGNAHRRAREVQGTRRGGVDRMVI